MKIKILFSFFFLISIITYSAGSSPVCYRVNPTRDMAQSAKDNHSPSDMENTASAVNSSPCTLTATLTSTPYYCTSSYEGSATVIPSGGTPPYTFFWLPGGQTIQAISPLIVGIYSVTVTDSSGCTATGSVMVGTGTVSAAAIPSSIIAGDSTELTATCGIPATYSWSPQAYVTDPNSQITYAHPPVTTVFTVTAYTSCGAYVNTVTVTVSGCTFQDSVVKSSYYCPSLAGSINIYPYGGTPPYSFLWAPGGQTTAALTGLNAGSYSVTITDAGGCNLTNAITIPLGIISYSVSINPLYINAGDSTLLSVNCDIPATYYWIPTAYVTNVDSANTFAHPATTTEYTVAITTSCGIYLDSVKASVNCFALSMSSTPSYNCSSSSYDGTITVAPSGGILPYTYSWLPTGSTTASVSNINPGTYTVIVKDNTGCISEGVDTVGVRIPILVATATPSVIIAGDSTYLSATCSSGASGYSWSPSAYVTSPTSEYTYAHPPVTTVFTVIAITDNCPEEIFTFDTVVVTGCTLHDSIVETPYYCASLGGTITVFPYGGTAPYTYLWSPGGQTTATITGLTPTANDVDITDANGCNLTNAIYVATAPILYSAEGNPLYTIAGDSVLLTATCNIPATYSWSPSISVTNPNSDSTYAHPTVSTVYTVTITTACGTFIEIIPINIQCFFLNMSSTVSYYCSSSSSWDDGTASVNPVGGTPPYTYSWSPGGQTTAEITGLNAATYSVIVYDATGCSTEDSVSVSSSSAMFTVSGNPSFIVSGDSALLIATSNVEATFSWAPSSSVTHSDSASTYAHPSSTTLYTVTITTTCGVYSYTILISVNCFNTTDISTPAYCSIYGDTAVGVPLGGTPPYTYYWSPGGQTTDTVTGLSVGTYSVIIWDATGCSSTVPVVISADSAPPPLNCSATPPVINTGDSSYLSANCGAPATYIWSPTTGLTNPTSQNTYAQPTVTTIYTVSALTICGTVVSYDTVMVITNLNVPEVAASAFKLNIYPNPSSGIITIQLENEVPGQINENNTIQVEIYNALGEKVFLRTAKYSHTQDSRFSINLGELDSGIYTLRLQTENMTEVRKIVIIKKGD